MIKKVVYTSSVDCVMPSSIISVSENNKFDLQKRKLQPLYYWRENDMILYAPRSLIRALRYVLDILQTEEAFPVEEYKHTHTNQQHLWIKCWNDYLKTGRLEDEIYFFLPCRFQKISFFPIFHNLCVKQLYKPFWWDGVFQIHHQPPWAKDRIYWPLNITFSQSLRQAFTWSASPTKTGRPQKNSLTFPSDCWSYLGSLCQFLVAWGKSSVLYFIKRSLNFLCVAHLSDIKFLILVITLVSNPFFWVDLNFIQYLLK